jgi:hypothetical protein
MEDLLQEEIVKLEGELTKLKSAVEYIETAKISIESASKIINTIIKLKEEFDQLSEKAYMLIDKVDKVNFPSRFDIIDSRISTLINGLEALQPRIEAGNKSVVIETKALSKHILSELGESRNKVLFRLEQQSKDIRIATIGVIATFLLLLTFGVLFYLNVL